MRLECFLYWGGVDNSEGCDALTRMSCSCCTSRCVCDCELHCRHCSHFENRRACESNFQMSLLSSSISCGYYWSTTVSFAVCLWPMRLCLLSIVVVLPLFMPNVNCQAWSDLKHFLKAWLDLTEDKVSANQNGKATVSVVTKWHAAIPDCYLDAMETMLYYMWKS